MDIHKKAMKVHVIADKLFGKIHVNDHDAIKAACGGDEILYRAVWSRLMFMAQNCRVWIEAE